MAGKSGKKSASTAAWHFALAALAAALVRVPDFFLPMNRDSGIFAYGGWRILHGALPYTGFWDNKLPGVYYLNALAIHLFGPTQAGLVTFQIIWSAATAIVFLCAARRVAGSRAALIAALIFCLYHGCYGLQDDGNYTESYVALPALLAVLFTLKWSRGRMSDAVPAAAGALAMLAVLIKQPAGSAFVAMIAFALASGRKGRRAALAMAAGACVIAAAVLVWMAAGGMLKDAYEANVVFNRLYIRDAYTSGLHTAQMNLLCGLNLMALPLVGAALGIFCIGRSRGSGKLAWLLVPWLLADIAGLAMGGRFTNHYFVAMLPSTMLLCAVFLDCIKSRDATLGAAVAGLVLFAGPIWSYEGRLGRGEGIYSAAQREVSACSWVVTRRLGQGVRHQSEEVAQWVRGHSSPSDTIYVWCWDTRIAFLAQRAMPSRYLHTHPLGATGFGRDARIRELARDLETRRPKFVVDGSPFLPTTAPLLSSMSDPPSTCPFFRLDGYGPVKEVVARNYKPLGAVAGYPVYQLKK